eukprot:scaffold2848_cov30-Tisochrysis_lutea.AAC.4
MDSEGCCYNMRAQGMKHMGRLARSKAGRPVQKVSHMKTPTRGLSGSRRERMRHAEALRHQLQNQSTPSERLHPALPRGSRWPNLAATSPTSSIAPPTFRPGTDSSALPVPRAAMFSQYGYRRRERRLLGLPQPPKPSRPSERQRSARVRAQCWNLASTRVCAGARSDESIGKFRSEQSWQSIRVDTNRSSRGGVVRIDHPQKEHARGGGSD